MSICSPRNLVVSTSSVVLPTYPIGFNPFVQASKDIHANLETVNFWM
jgi:hypothetical protein